MKSLRLLPGLTAALVLLLMLALAPPVAADSAPGGAASVNASLEEDSAASVGGVDGARVSVTGGVTVDPAMFPAGRLSASDVTNMRVGWDPASDAGAIGITGLDDGTVYALTTLPDGTVFVGGDFNSADGGNTWIRQAGVWKSTGWVDAGRPGVTIVDFAVHPDATKVYGARPDGHVLEFTTNGTVWGWDFLCPPYIDCQLTGGSINAVAVGADGTLYAGGSFTSPVTGLAKFNPTAHAWESVGGGIYGSDRDVNELLVVGNDLYIGGSFLNVGAADGLPAANLARWDGSDWYVVGDELAASQPVDALAESMGVLYVANRDTPLGGFTVWMVDDPTVVGGSTWTSLAHSSGDTYCTDAINNCSRVYALAANQYDLFMGGTFYYSDGTDPDNVTFNVTMDPNTVQNLARYNRQWNHWFPMEGGANAPAEGSIPDWMHGVRALTIHGSSLYAGGQFTQLRQDKYPYTFSPVPVGRVARWNREIVDLAIYGRVDPEGMAYAGQRVTYYVTVENLGYAATVAPRIHARLPDTDPPIQLHYDSCSAGSGLDRTCYLSQHLAPGETYTVYYEVDIPADGESGTEYVLETYVEDSEYDPNLSGGLLGSNEATLSVTGQEYAQLSLDMTGPASKAGNEEAVYTINVTNNGPSTARNVQVVDTLPAGVEFKNAPAGCKYTSADNKVTCKLGTMQAGTTKTLDVSYMAGSCAAGSLTNSAAASSDQTPSDENPTDSVATNITAFTGLAINKSDGVALIGVSQPLTYDIKVWACGASVANVQITDPLPASLTGLSVTPSGTCSLSGSNLTCNAGTLAAGGSLDVTVSATTGAAEATLTNTATATGDGVSSVTSTDTTQVGDYADLELVLDAPENVVAGEAFDYEIDVTNWGPAATSDASITVDLPDGIYYNSATGATCTKAADSISANLTCSIGAIAVDGTATIAINAVAVQPVQGPNVSYTTSPSVSSTKGDPDSTNNTKTVVTSASVGTTTQQALDGVTVNAYVFETVGTDKRAYGVASLGPHFYLGGLNDYVRFADSSATTLTGSGKLNYKNGEVPVFDGAFNSAKAGTLTWNTTLTSGEEKVPEVAGFKIDAPADSVLSQVTLPDGKVKGTTESLKLDPPEVTKLVNAEFELTPGTTKPSYGGKVTEAFSLEAGMFDLDVPANAPISNTGINSSSNVDLVMPEYFGSGEVNDSSAGLRHWPGLENASMTVGAGVGAGFGVPALKFDTAENFKLKDGTGQLVSAGGVYEAVVTESILEIDLPANDGKEVKKPADQGGTLNTVYLKPRKDESGNPVYTESGKRDADITTSALPEFHLDVAKGDLKVEQAALKRDRLEISMADYKMPDDLGQRNKLTPDVKMKPKKDDPNGKAEMKVNTDDAFEVADMDVKGGEHLKVKDAHAKVVQQADGFKLDVTSGKVQVMIKEQNDKEADLHSATVDKDGKLDGKLAVDEIKVTVASTELTMKGLSKDHALTSDKGLESDAGKWKLPDELKRDDDPLNGEKEFIPEHKIKVDDEGLKVNVEKKGDGSEEIHEVPFPKGKLDQDGHKFEDGTAKVKEATDNTYKIEIRNKIEIKIPGSDAKKQGTNDKPDAELTLDSQKKIKGKVKDMELKVSGLTLKDSEWQVEKGQVFSDHAKMKQISDFGGEEASMGQMAVLDKDAGLVLGEEAGAAALAGMSPAQIAEVADIDITLPSLEYLGFSMFNVEGSVEATDRYAANGNYCVDDEDTDYPDECDGVLDSYAIHAAASLGLEDIMGGGGGDDGGGSGGGSGGGDGGGEGGGLPCSSISVEIDLVLGEHQTVMVAVKPTDGKILAQTLAVANNPNATDTADLELRAIAAKLMLSCSIPLGQSGLQVSEFRGSFEMDKDINMMRISVGADIETVMSVPPPIDAAVAEASVDATIQIKPSPYFRVEGEVTLIGFISMAEGYAQVDFTNYGMPNGVEAEVTIRYPVFMEGYAGFHLWTDWDPVNGDATPELSDFHFTGWAGVRIGISEGLIWEGCLGSLCISIPPFDLWLAEVSAEVGEFCKDGGGSVWGFKCGISILNGLWSGGLYIDADGNFDFGDVDEYVLYDNAEVMAAFLSWREAKEGRLSGSAALAASQKYKGFAFAPDDLSYNVNIDKEGDLAFMLTRMGDIPTLTLTDPHGNEINPLSDVDEELTGRPDVAYETTTQTVKDENGDDVTVTQETYVIDEAATGAWKVNLHGDITEDTEYLFGVIGAGLAPSLGNVQAVDNGNNTADVTWTLVDDATPIINIYATKGPTEQTVSSPDPEHPDGTMTFPVFGGERLLTNVETSYDGTVNNEVIDLSGLESGTYYIHVEADDFSDPPQHAYAMNGAALATVNVSHALPATWDDPNIVVTPEYMGLHVDFTPMTNPDVDKYIVRFADAPSSGTSTYVREVDTTHTFASSEDWLEPGKTYYVAVAAYDGDTGHEECVVAGCDLTDPDVERTFVGATVIWSAEVTGVPLGASFELVTTEAPGGVTGGGTTATAYFKVINTGEELPTGPTNVGLSVLSAPDGINVALANRFVMATPVGTVSSLELSATDTLRGGIYPVTIQGSAGGTVRTLDLLVEVTEPYFELVANPGSITLAANGTATVQIAVTRFNGEADPINLDLATPGGVQWSLDDDRLEGEEIGTLSLTDTFLLPGGSDYLYVIGSDGESKYHLAIPFTAAKPEFTLAAVPMTLWAMPGGEAKAFELKLGAEYGWDDPVTLSINSSYLPSGILAGLAATVGGVTADSITVTPPTTAYLRVMAGANAAEDLYVLHVDATATGQTEVVEPRLLVATSCSMADLSVTVTDSPDPVMTGENVTYALSVTNNGPCTSAARMLTAALPTGATFVSGTGCTASGCTIAALAAGASSTPSMIVKMPSSGTGDASTTFTLSAATGDTWTGNDSAVAVTRLNNAPVVGEIALEPAATEGQLLYATATFTDADGNGPYTCTVDYGSGAEAGSVSGDKCYGPTHVFSDNGDYSVTITVTDADAAAGTKTESETVANAAPVVGALDVSIRPSLENQAVAISATFTDAGVNDGDWTCTIDFGDGTSTAGVITNGTCRVETHTYADNGGYDVTIAVTDKDDDTGTRTASLVVNNVAPDLTVSASATTIVEGGSTTLTASATDAAGDADPLSYWFDCTGDGRWDFGPQSETSAVCAYADNGTFEARVKVDDGDGGWTSDALTIVVDNAAPSFGAIVMSPPSPLIGGGDVNATAEFTDAGVRDFLRTSTMDVNPDDDDLPPAPATCTVDYGDGTVQTLPVHGSTCYGLDHRYMAAGIYTVIVEVTDKDGGIGHAEATYEVINTPPEIVLPMDMAGTDDNEGTEVWAVASFTDPDDGDEHTCSVNYGDGSADAAGAVTGDPINGYTCTGPAHAYADNTTTPETGYEVTVVVTDEYGISDEETMSQVVLNVRPDVAALTPATVDEGSPFTQDGSFIDPGADLWSGTVDYGDSSGEQTLTLALDKTFSLGHTYADDGSYTVTVCVKDDDEVTPGCGTTTVTVRNVAPVLSAVAATNINEDGTTHLTGTITDPGILDTFTLVVNWGEGALETFTYAAGTKSFDVTHQYLDDNPTGSVSDKYTVSLTLTDDDRGVGTGSTTLTVTNVAPVLGDVAATSIDENGETHLSGTITDPGTQDTFTLVVNWGEGALETFNLAAGAQSFNVTHKYLDDNPTATAADVYPISLTLTDDDTGQATANTSLTVSNVAPVLGDVAATNIDEDGTTHLTGKIADPGSLDTFTLVVDWGEGAAETFTYAAGTASFEETHQYLDDNPTATPADDYTVNLTITDDDTGKGTGSTSLTVSNVAPVVATPVVVPATTNEGESITASATFSDQGTEDTFTCEVDYGDGTARVPGVVSGSVAEGYTCSTPAHTYADNATPEAGGYMVTLYVTDDDTETGSNSVAHVVNNVAPAVTIDTTTQTRQYSDRIAPVTITATDMKADPLALTTRYNVDGGAWTPGLPGFLAKSADGSCIEASTYAHTCTWTLTGALDVPAGTYTIEATVDDGDGDPVTVSTVVVVKAEDVWLTFSDTNPGTVKVATAGGTSEPFTIIVNVEERQTPDAGLDPAAGDISRTVIHMQLVAISNGAITTGACTQSATGTGYDGVATLTCNFVGVKVDAYSIEVDVNGGYYAGKDESAVAVYDPSLGFVTGGGWFYWPGTANPATGYPGDKTNFGFTTKYKKGGANAQGNLVVVRHTSDGLLYRLKGNVLTSLSLSPANNAFGYATIKGKGNYLEPGWTDPIGNYSFTVYIEDRNDPGTGIDRFWVEIRDKSNHIIPAMSLPTPAANNAVNINGGNIIVPHAGAKTAALASFDALPGSDGVLLKWQTLSEPGLASFNLYRSLTGEGDWARCNAEPIATLPDDMPEPYLYEWLDTSADPAAAGWYLLEAVDPDGVTVPLAQTQVQVAVDGRPIYLPLISR